MPSTTLLITIGSTLFPALTDRAVTPEFISLCSSNGITDLIVQYGKADLTLPPGIKFIPNTSGEVTDTASTYTYPVPAGAEVRLTVMRFTSRFEELVKSVDLIISHAGSGSILTVLRAGKPLLVVPNSSLMDDHQSELAQALKSEGYLKVTTVENLTDALSGFLQMGTAADGDGAVKPFPPVATSRFANILDETVGFEA